MANESHSVVYQSVKVLIDSRYRNNPSIFNVSDFTYSLNRPVGRVSSVYVESAQIPFTYYTTTVRNNSLIISDGVSIYQGFVVPGNYNSSTILTALKSTLDAMGVPGAVWTVTFDPSRLEIRIANPAGFNVIVDLDPVSIGPSIGFTTSTLSLSPDHISDGILDLSGPRYLVIKSQLIGENRAYPTAVSALYTADVSSDAIIHTIPVNTNPGGVILDLVPEPRNNILGFKTSFQNDIDFRLEDDKGNLLDLNGGQWSIQLTFELR